MRVADHVLPVDPVLILLFARSVGDTDPVYESQIGAEVGDPVVCPLTFAQCAEHFDPGSMTRPQLPFQIEAWGGSGDRLHAEQHFEYFRALRAYERLSVRRRAGATWERQGSAGHLEFSETITDFVDSSGEVALRSRKVGVRIVTGEQPC